ncbi:syntaxin-8 isoform X4 [Corvus moneduloides]|uniref:syntaxin-8 isoform X4 n=1 Tax=Corvus moneduloides TaxID=1196302 RepID=UPI001362411D|nr:syntaxin-8 isoform X4 [Corvus moneduloides]
MAPDPWLPLLAAARQLAQDIAEKIQERNRCQRSGESSAKVNVAIRSSLQSLREKIEELRELLLWAVAVRQITQLEGDRRQNLVDDLLTRHKQLEASYRSEGPEPDMTRDHRRPHEPGGEHGRPAAHPDTAREDGGQEINVLRDAGGDRAAAHRHRRGRALADALTRIPPEQLLRGEHQGSREGPPACRDLLCWESTPQLGINSTAAD